MCRANRECLMIIPGFDFEGIKDEIERLSPSEVLIDPVFKGNN